MMTFKLYAPSRLMFAVSVIFACLAILGAANTGVPLISGNGVGLLTVAFVILAVSSLVRTTDAPEDNVTASH